MAAAAILAACGSSGRAAEAATAREVTAAIVSSSLDYRSTDLNRPSIALTAAETQRFGYTPSKVDRNQLLWTGAGGG